jgi:transcription factor WhiB
MTRRYLNVPQRQRQWTVQARNHRWRQQAACAEDPSDGWFIHPNRLPPEERTRIARMCTQCPVVNQCHLAAITEQAVGVTRAGGWWRPNWNGNHTLWVPWAWRWLLMQQLPKQLINKPPEE